MNPNPGTVIPIIAYAVGEGIPADSLSLQAGDSVFVYDGELFFRACIKGQDFFVSKREILEHSDSLVIYQNYRIGSPAHGVVGVEAAVQKTERQQCTMITKNGSRCKRLAMPGSNRCWQHKR